MCISKFSGELTMAP